jgi:hypothetical protein
MLARCIQWPNCCLSKLTEYSDKIDEWIANPVPTDRVLIEMPKVYLCLICMERWSPDPKWRRVAAEQLKHPVWKQIPEGL